MTDEEIKDAWLIVNAATEGPWEWTEPGGSIRAGGEFLMNRELDEGVLNHSGTLWPVSAENREFIAASRTLVVRLLEEVGRLRVKLDPTQRDLVVEVCHDLTLRVMRNDTDEFPDHDYGKIYRDQEAAIRALLALTEGR